MRPKFLHPQDRISLFNLMKRALYSASKLNSRDIQKCNCFWVPSNDLFAFARKAVVLRQRRPAFTDWETRGRLCEKKNCHKKVNSPFWTKVWSHPSPNQKFLDPPLGAYKWYPKTSSHQATSRRIKIFLKPLLFTRIGLFVFTRNQWIR